MHTLLFGTAGIPHSTPRPTTFTAIEQVKRLGLDAMEIEFVRGVNISEQKASLVKETAHKNKVTLTCHGQYWVNLNAEEPVLQQSVERILTASRRAFAAGAWSICYHMAYYGKEEIGKCVQKIRAQLLPIIKQLQDEGNTIWLRPETGGKINQCGEIDELIKVSESFEQVLPTIDWAHHYARTVGKVNSYPQFADILTKIESKLGRRALDNMHMHLEGIEFTPRGERNHVNIAQCSLQYPEVLRALKEFKVKGVLISESPNIEEDALLFKRTYEKM